MVCSLWNYLGTGSNPRLHLSLGANGPGWTSFTIDYGSSGNIPSSDDPNNQWLAWDVKDEGGQYYGTINLKGSNGKQVSWSSYEGGKGFWLEGIGLDPQPGYPDSFKLTCKGIHRPVGSGPFPDALPATPAVYPNSSERIVLSVAGDKIVNNRGKAVLLKGVARPSLEWSAQGEQLGPGDIGSIRSWGCNAIRVSLCQQLWFASQGKTVKGSYKQIVDAIIYYAIQHDTAVILDLHRIVVAEDSPVMANSQSERFWAEVAAEYKDFGTVMFELFNEPHGVAHEVWLNGDKDKDYAGYQQLYNAVRGTGAKNICIVSGLDWAYELSFVSDAFRVVGENIVYCSHPYNDKGNPSYNPNFDNSFRGILGKYPIIFTEFGGNNAQTCKDPAVYQYKLDYADQHGVNWTAWAWYVDPSKPEFPCLISDWQGTPWNGGVWVHENITSKPGTPINSG